MLIFLQGCFRFKAVFCQVPRVSYTLLLCLYRADQNGSPLSAWCSQHTLASYQRNTNQKEENARFTSSYPKQIPDLFFIYMSNDGSIKYFKKQVNFRIVLSFFLMLLYGFD